MAQCNPHVQACLITVQCTVPCIRMHHTWHV
jgi:hypothetical protein